MKKLIYCAAALVTALFAGSCQRELLDTAQSGSTVTFAVEIPEVATKAAAVGNDASMIDDLVYAVYMTTATTVDDALNDWDAKTTFLYAENYTANPFRNGSATISLELLNDQNHIVLLWAQHDNTWVAGKDATALTNISYPKTLSVNAGEADKYAAFSEVKFIPANTKVNNDPIKLTRPFAQINLATVQPTNYAVEIAGTTLEVSGVGQNFNVASQHATGNTTVTYTWDGKVYEKPYEKPLTVNSQDYTHYLAMGYVFANGNVTVDYDINAGNHGIIDYAISQVPVAKNYRTNIIGNLLTSSVDYNVTLDKEWGGTNNVDVWDGKALSAPEYDEANATYTIKTAAELAWFAAAVNGTLPSDARTSTAPFTFEGKTVSLVSDIDLGNNVWTPIGYWETFDGIFDGGNHTIRNLYIPAKEADAYLGLFGCTNNATIKNVTLLNAYVSAVADESWAGGQIAALVGFPNGTTTIENVNITGLVQIDGDVEKLGAQRIGAVVGGFKGQSLTLTNVKVDVIEGSFVKGNLYVGGVVGAPLCPVTMTNVTSNIDVYSKDGIVGGLIGFAYAGSTFENCSVSGDVYRTSTVDNDNQMKRIGGLIGTWGNAEGKIELSSCSYTGELHSSNTEYDYDGLVGRGYSIDKTDGSLWIDGYKYLAAGLGEDENGVAHVTSSKGIESLIAMVDAGADEMNVVLDTDIDLLKLNENGEPVPTDPIGSYRNDNPFKGTFDGQGHTIKNLNQNTWELNNGYYYGDLGLGLFGMVEDATIKNLVIDTADISGESGLCGVIAATAYGDCTFENITVKNAHCADYQYYAGGIVGWASGNHQYINCNIDASTTIAAQWGDFDNSTGGVIGGAGGSAQILLKDCTVACRLDVYNDVTSSYQWYAYRRCGMLIGNSGKTEDRNGTTYAVAPQLTCENVTVNYGDWMNYTYCEFAGTSWPWVRAQAGISNSAYSNPRYGHPTDANGNPVVDDNHVHNEGEGHHVWLPFDQLYGGGQGVYGTKTHEGVTINYPESFYHYQGYKANGDIYTIYSGEGFKTIATEILSDASKTVTIELADDIDLAGIEWPAVCTKAAFVLDGKGKSIKNLTTSAVEDHGFYSTAMFTSTRKATTIKNLVVENATVTGKGGDNSHGAVLVACNYDALNIEGVTVKNSTVSNCDRSSVLVTYLYFTTATVKNCVVEGCTVNSIGTAGAVLGMNNSHNFEATGNTVKNTTISSSEGGNKAGILIGTWQNAGTLTESNNVVENSKAINAGEETNNNIGRHA